MIKDTNKPPTWYVLDPRDDLCSKINPKLWAEFTRHSNEPVPADAAIYTEAFCVQWLDGYYARIKDDRHHQSSHSRRTDQAVTEA